MLAPVKQLVTPTPPTYSIPNKARDSWVCYTQCASASLNHNVGLLTLYPTEDLCLGAISHPENASGFALFQWFPDMVIYVAKHRLKSKGKGSVLIG